MATGQSSTLGAVMTSTLPARGAHTHPGAAVRPTDHETRMARAIIVPHTLHMLVGAALGAEGSAVTGTGKRTTATTGLAAVESSTRRVSLATSRCNRC